MFGINPRTCQRCLLKEQCLADGSKGSGGRRITVIRRKLSDAPTKAQPVAPLEHPREMSHPTSQPLLPVLWLDFPTTRLRRDLVHQLRQHQIEIESTHAHLTMTSSKLPFFTRAQRAHRRLTWTERWERNAATRAVSHWRVNLFGIPSNVLDWLNSLKPSPVLIM